MSSFEHITVLQVELVESLNIKSGHHVVDCTAGGGGHTAGILERVGPKGKVLAFDRDEQAIIQLKNRFAREIESGQLELIRASFSSLAQHLETKGLLGTIHGICADIGVSSPQIDLGDRGFSFNKDGPLDMRMDQQQDLSAATVVNNYADSDLLRIFREFGEEPQAKPIVRAIVKQRAIKPLSSTLELADLVASTVRYKDRSRKHPATKIFQALRIEVNGELDELAALIETFPLALAPHGRGAIISFHSLEDRMIKQGFKHLAEGNKANIDRHLPLTAAQLSKLEARQFSLIKPFPILPSEAEQTSNPRSRSAKLRVIERLAQE